MGFLCISDNCYQVCLNCGLSQEFWDCNCFQLAFSIAEGGQSLQHSNIFAGLRWPTVERQSFFWRILFDMENKHRDGDSQDIIFVLLSGLILKTCLCCQHCPKSGCSYLADGLFL